jgi:hypothetical protein
MTGLEARYRWLLRAYPVRYLQDRGEEMLDTLLEAAAAGRSWPSARDARALILGGLRVRAWHGKRQTAAVSLRQALMLAAVLELISFSAFDLDEFRAGVAVHLPVHSMLYAWVSLALGLLSLGAAAGAWVGRRAIITVTALATAGLYIYQPWEGLAGTTGPVLALVVLVILVIRRERLPRSWLWPAMMVFAGFLLLTSFPGAGVLHVVGESALFAVPGAAIAWSLVDARPITAAAVWLTVLFGADFIQDFADGGWGIYLLGYSLPAIIAIAAAIVGVWRLRRQAIL